MMPWSLVLGPVQAQVTRYFAGRRASAHHDVLAALDSDRYLALLTAIDDLLAEPPLSKAARGKARREGGALIRRAYRRVDTHVRAAEDLPQGPDRDTELHEARKAAKRLRYATEAAEPALGTPARDLVKRVKSVQELLGDHQDSVVTAPVLRELGAQAQVEGGNGFTFGILHAAEDHHLPDSALGPAWRHLRKAASSIR
jgi:CHAD domain-containing protein